MTKKLSDTKVFVSGACLVGPWESLALDRSYSGGVKQYEGGQLEQSWVLENKQMKIDSLWSITRELPNVFEQGLCSRMTRVFTTSERVLVDQGLCKYWHRESVEVCHHKESKRGTQRGAHVLDPCTDWPGRRSMRVSGTNVGSLLL